MAATHARNISVQSFGDDFELQPHAPSGAPASTAIANMMVGPANAGASSVDKSDFRSFRALGAEQVATPNLVWPLNDTPLPTDLGKPNVINANGAGKTQLIAQSFNNALGRYEFTGNIETDAVLIGSRWTVTNMTYSFPTAGSQYADQGYDPMGGEPTGQVVFNAAQQTAARYAFGLISSYTNLTFTEITETNSTHANLRLSQTSSAAVGSAQGHFPSSSAQAGDIWFGMTGQPYYSTPAIGNWGQATMMHEIGHAMGLKHGHQDYTSLDLSGNIDANPGGTPRYGSAALPLIHDGQDWSLMTYRSDPTDYDPSNPGQPSFNGDGFNQPQTYMQDEIAALQHLYGANFNTNSGNTTYTWNPTTGVESINGVAQGAPSSNKISMTLWDGNGVDTYDLSNYTTNLKINLNPGEFSTFSDAQLVNHQAYQGGSAVAVGNVANARLYNNDPRSLIENATGGSGNDLMIANQAGNALRGNLGNDELVGSAGDDRLYGGADADKLYGDIRPALPSGIGMGSGQFVKNVGSTNHTPTTGINVTSLFSLSSNAEITNSTSLPHVTITATSDAGTFDYYQLNVEAGTLLTFDMDRTSADLDSYIFLMRPTGDLLAWNDDAATVDAGSTRTQDSYLTYTVQTAGTYVIEVGQYNSSTSSKEMVAGQTYQLHISATATSAPAAGSGSGNDVLDGGTGADYLQGGLGNDTYYVDSVGDAVIEATGQGTDIVYSTVSFVLGANQSVETLQLDASTIAQPLNLTGNNIGNVLTGNAGANVLNGGGGADLMQGGSGNDSYLVDNAGDVVRESSGGNSGVDTVVTTVSYALGAGQYVETLQISSTVGAAALNLTGNELANALLGNAGSNALQGLAGADVLQGGGGRDIIVPGNDTAADTIRFNAISDSTGGNRDQLLSADFNNEDKLDFAIRPTAFVGSVTTGALNNGSNFNIEIGNAVNGLLNAGGAVEAVLFDPNSGGLNQAGFSYLVVDANNDGSYTANNDYLVELVNFTGTLDITDFI